MKIKGFDDWLRLCAESKKIKHTHVSGVWTLYLFLDPLTFDVRYVGATSASPKKRYREHLQHAIHAVSPGRRARWILQLRERGLKPILINFLYCKSAEELSLLEQVWIKRFQKAGYKIFADGGGLYAKQIKRCYRARG